MNTLPDQMTSDRQILEELGRDRVAALTGLQKRQIRWMFNEGRITRPHRGRLYTEFQRVKLHTQPVSHRSNVAAFPATPSADRPPQQKKSADTEDGINEPIQTRQIRLQLLEAESLYELAVAHARESPYSTPLIGAPYFALMLILGVLECALTAEAFWSTFGARPLDAFAASSVLSIGALGMIHATGASARACVEGRATLTDWLWAGTGGASVGAIWLAAAIARVFAPAMASRELLISPTATSPIDPLSLVYGVGALVIYVLSASVRYQNCGPWADVARARLQVADLQEDLEEAIKEQRP